ILILAMRGYFEAFRQQRLDHQLQPGRLTMHQLITRVGRCASGHGCLDRVCVRRDPWRSAGKQAEIRVFNAILSIGKSDERKDICTEHEPAGIELEETSTATVSERQCAAASGTLRSQIACSDGRHF